ncbi:MAG: hypothetical protein PHP02_02925 [Eubacteriales bacterium]|nr:hypothetical protein [Eubacteriales bacterium]
MTGEMEESRDAVKRRFPLGKALRLAGILPGVMFRLSRAHRSFGNSFVKETMRCGIPESAAWDMAEALRPRQFLKAARDRREQADAIEPAKEGELL